MNIELKGLSRDQVTKLLPGGAYSLCWRGSVTHGMYVPKSDSDSIDDKTLKTQPKKNLARSSGRNAKSDGVFIMTTSWRDEISVGIAESVINITAPRSATKRAEI